MFNRIITTTADGSNSIALQNTEVSFHSKHGAMQESQHVFIASGLAYYHAQHPEQSTISIFEMGFGSGLNALLSLQYANENSLTMHYESIDAFPLTAAEWQGLNYGKLLHMQNDYEQILTAAWQSTVNIGNYFKLLKQQQDLLTYAFTSPKNIIYFDAFAPSFQPELWTVAVFDNLYQSLTTNGILVTYCSKGWVRRNMEAAGFMVEKLQGPPGKREIVRAVKKI